MTDTVIIMPRQATLKINWQEMFEVSCIEFLRIVQLVVS